MERARRVLDGLARGVAGGRFPLRDGQAVQVGYWSVVFLERDGVLHGHEPDPEHQELREGAHFTLRCLNDQERECERHGARFDPPPAVRLTACAAGVLDSHLPVAGIRYRYREPMSGWLLTTEADRGGVEAVEVVHTYHVTARRPEILSYLGLPPGYCFDLSIDRVWHDPEIEAEEPW